MKKSDKSGILFELKAMNDEYSVVGQPNDFYVFRTVPYTQYSLKLTQTTASFYFARFQKAGINEFIHLINEIFDLQEVKL